ncbi:NAD(P)/FAD-dependent oxidoreductase [Desulfurivibrio alkaliphilus]|uniref:Nitrite reductase (NAD(P)H) n=1 Tax=Desulfurivibrio alkaliphilus (strain DSM 19089 / UNIQEM U267 / AHT2) TaxID=589865 RepID=D6Z576_DESAT|nr:NAD(P)/FAD-dependent oxidoreductase [Desulfurivibrio alkaliphilus]ADH84733.1 Nitrite reductase (NAD(P)H) [Desulfurivibrio alkaliphilus AHT 2]
MLKDGEKGAVLQRDKESYAIVPHLPLGLINPAQLRRIADVAEKYQCAAIKVTSAARIAIVGLKEGEIDQAWQDLDMAPGAAVGMCVRSIKTCPGNTLCRLGKQDSMGLAKELDENYHGKELPGKLKLGVSGCPNQCGESSVKDIGFVGKANGWTILVGGNAASRPRLAETLMEDVDDAQARRITAAIIDYFAKEGKKGERMGRFIDRVGFETFKQQVCS